MYVSLYNFIENIFVPLQLFEYSKKEWIQFDIINLLHTNNGRMLCRPFYFGYKNEKRLRRYLVEF